MRLQPGLYAEAESDETLGWVLDLSRLREERAGRTSARGPNAPTGARSRPSRSSSRTRRPSPSSASRFTTASTIPSSPSPCAAAYDDAARDARTLHEEAVAGHGAQTHTFDVVAFPHALVAAKLAGFQEQGFEAGYEHGLATAAERLLDWIHQSPFADRLPDLVERVFDVHPDVALAVAASLRCGHELDAPLCAALRASPNPPVVLPDAADNGDSP